MSNQIDITGGARVRNLNGVITGLTGVLSSLPINGANGIPQLDSSGKILVSQLPNSVMEFLGTWNAATNTPTLANGTGNAGDVYLCTVAGTVDFGAGPITFQDGDYVVYSGSTWERSSGAMGTVTSVGASITGNSIGITGSPVTTAGTLAFAFAGTSGQYINGAGNLVTFPSLTGYVPYSGATGNVNLGEWGITSGYYGFDLTPTGTPTSVGTMFWDSFYRTPSVITGTGATTLQLGQEQVTLVHNNTGATLTDGQVVYVTGSTGELPSVALATNTTEAASSVTFGVVTESIPHGSDGFVTTSGMIHGLDTLAFTEGQALWLGATAGTFTNVKPVAPANSVLIGYVIKRAGGNGSIFVKIQNGYELEELHDVLISGVTNNEGLFWDSATSLWKNKTIATALGYTPANDSLVVHLAGAETITGAKIFTQSIRAGNGLSLYEGAGSGAVAGTNYVGMYMFAIGSTHQQNFNFSNGNVSTLAFSDTGNYTYTLPTTSGTIALVGGAGVGTVTSVAALTLGTSGTDLSSTVANSTTTPVITLNVPTASATNRGALSSSDWSTFNGKQAQLNGTGFVKASGTTISYDNSTYVPTSRTLTINGTAYDLSADRSWSINSMVYPSAGIAVSTGTAWGTSIVDNSSNWNTAYSLRISSATAPLSISSNVISISQASSTTNGYLSSTDWNTFNNKQGQFSLTAGKVPFAVGSSSLGDTSLNYNGGNFGFGTAASTYRIDVSGSVNVTGNYYVNGVAVTTGGVTGTGITNYLPKFTGTSTIGNSIVSESGSVINVNGDITIPFYYAMKFGGSGAATYIGDFNADGTLQFATGSSTKMRLTPTGNLGLGVTPSAWASLIGLDIVEGGGAISSNNGGLYLTENAYFNAGWKYKSSSSILAALYSQVLGVHAWYTAPSGTAGNPISFTQAMTLTANGNLLVGTTTDSGTGKLQVNGNAAINGTVIGTDQTFGGSYRTFAFGANANGYNRIFATTDASDGLYLNAATGRGIYFRVNGGGANVVSIDSTGAATFSSSVTADIFYSRAFGVTSGGTLYGGIGTNLWANGGSVTDTGIYASGSLILDAGGVEKMRISSTGNVAIGTTDTANGILNLNGVLDINKDSATVGARWRRGATTVGYIGTGDWAVNGLGTSDFGISSGSSGALVFGTQGGAERMRISSGGQVGIGTTPTQLLTLGGAATVQMSLVSTSTTGASEIYFGSPTSVYRGYIGYIHNGDYFTFNTAASEKMRLNASGNLSIGNTNDTYKLDVSGTGRFNGTSASPLLYLTNTTGGTTTDFTITENVGLIINSYEGASARSIDLRVGGTSALSIASTGAATFSSSVTAGGNITSGGSVIIPSFETATNVLSFRAGIPEGFNVGIRAKAINTGNRDGLEILGYNGIDFSIANGTIVATRINYAGVMQIANSSGTLGTLVGSERLNINGGIYAYDTIKSTNVFHSVNGFMNSYEAYNAWELGNGFSTSGLTLKTTSYVTVRINGTVYKLATVN